MSDAAGSVPTFYRIMELIPEGGIPYSDLISDRRLVGSYGGVGNVSSEIRKMSALRIIEPRWASGDDVGKDFRLVLTAKGVRLLEGLRA